MQKFHFPSVQFFVKVFDSFSSLENSLCLSYLFPLQNVTCWSETWKKANLLTTYVKIQSKNGQNVINQICNTLRFNPLSLHSTFTQTYTHIHSSFQVP